MANLKDFMSDPEVKKLVGQAQWLSAAMFKTKDSVNWEKLNDRFGQLLMQLAKKTEMKVGEIHRQLSEVKASLVQAGKLSLQQLKKMPKGTRLDIDGVPNTMGPWGAERSAPGTWRVWNNQERVSEVLTDEKLADMIKNAKSAAKASTRKRSATAAGGSGKVIGDKLKGIVDAKRKEVSELQSEIKEIERVWKSWDFKTMVKMGLIDQKLAKQAEDEAAQASFKGAVPGNLADNTKPSTPASQMETVELLKQGGILPPEEKAEDYPVLTAQVKKEIIATLLKRKQPKLAMWASRNLKVQAAKNYASVVFLQNSQDFNDFRGSGGKGIEGFFDSSEKEMMKYLQQWDYGDNYGEVVDPMQMKGSRDDVYKSGRYLMTYNSGLGYAGLYVKA